MMKKITSINNLLTFFIEFLVFYISIFEGMILLKHDYKAFIFPFIILPFLIASFFMRKFINNIIVFLLFHILLYVICFFLPLDSSEKTLIIFSLTIITILDFKFWSKNSLRKRIVNSPSIFFEIFFIIVLIHGTIVNYKEIIILSYALGLIFLLVKFITNYLDNLEVYIARNSNVKNVPIKQLISLNSSIFFIIIFLIFIILAIVKILNLEKYLYAPFEPILSFLKIALATFFKYLFSIATDSSNPSFSEVEETIPVETATALSGNNAFTKVLETLFNIFVFLLVAFFCYLAIKIIYSYLRNNFSKNNIKTDKIEYLNSEKIIDNEEKINSKFSLKPKNNNEKIRKIFYKRVKKNKKLNINNKLTAKEISNKISKNDNVSLEELTTLYEKARYSNINCSNEDVEKAKKVNK